MSANEELGIRVVIGRDVEVDEGKITAAVKKAVNIANEAGKGLNIFSGMNNSLLAVTNTLSSLTATLERVAANLPKVGDAAKNLGNGFRTSLADVENFKKAVTSLNTTASVKVKLDVGSNVDVIKAQLKATVAEMEKAVAEAKASTTKISPATLSSRISSTKEKLAESEARASLASSVGDVAAYQKADAAVTKYTAKLQELVALRDRLASITAADKALTKLTTGLDAKDLNASGINKLRTDLEGLIGTLAKLPGVSKEALASLNVPGVAQAGRTGASLLQAQFQEFGGLKQAPGTFKVATTGAAIASEVQGIKEVASVSEKAAKDIANLNNHLDHLEKVKGDKMAAMTKLIKELGIAAGLSEEQVKKFIDQFDRNTKAQSFFKNSDRFREGATATDVREAMDYKGQVRQDYNAVLATQKRIEAENAANATAAKGMAKLKAEEQAITEKRDLELAKMRGAANAKREADEKRWASESLAREKAANAEKVALYTDLFKQIEKGEAVLARQKAIQQERDLQTFKANAAAKADAEKKAREQQELQAIRDWKGYTPVNGGYIRNTYVQDVGLAQDAAMKENRWRERSSSSLVTDVDAARTQAFNEQLRRVLNTLQEISIQSNGAGVSLQRVREEFQKAGFTAKEWENRDIFNAANRGAKEFSANINRTTGQINQMRQASNAFSFLGESLGRMATRLAEFYSLRTIMFAIGRQIREATTAAIEFNQSMHDIIAISGESKNGMAAIGESIYAVATASRFTAKEVAESMQVLAQAGIAAKDLPVVTRTVDMFATSSATEPKLAADLFTTAMNVFDYKAKDSTKIANALTAALNNSKLEATGLATAFNYLAPQAQQLGYSLEQTLAIISTMAQSGVKPSTIGTGVSQMLKEFAAPKKRLLNLLDYYGLTPDDINPLKKNFADIVDSLNNAKGKAGEMGVQVNHLFQALETRVGRSAITAISQTGDAFRVMENSITGTSAALIAYDKSMEGAKARMNVVKQSIQQLVAEIGNTLAPMFVAATETLNGFIGVLHNEFAEALIIVGGMVATFALSLVTLTGAMKMLMLVSGTGGVMTGIIGVLGSGGTALAIMGIVAALGALGYALNYSKHEQEEQNKVILQGIEGNQKYHDVLFKIGNDTREGNAEFKRYQELIKSGKGPTTEANELAKKRVTITEDTRKTLNQLMADYPEVFRTLNKEIKTYKDLLDAINAVNQAKTKSASSARESYNEQIRSAASKAQTEVDEFRENVEKDPTYGVTFYNSQLTPEQRVAEFAKKKQKQIDDLSRDKDVQVLRQEGERYGSSDVRKGKNGEKITATSSKLRNFQVGADITAPLLVWDWQTEIPNNKPDPGDVNGARNGAAAASRAEFNLAQKQLQIDKKELALMLSDVKENVHTAEEIEQHRMDAVKLAEKIYKDSLAAAEAENKKDYYENGKLRKGVTQEKADELLRRENELAKKELEKDLQNVKKTYGDQEKQRGAIIRDAEAAANKATTQVLIDGAKAEGSALERALANKATTWDTKLAAYNEDVAQIREEHAQALKEKLAEIDKRFNEDLEKGNFAVDIEAPEFLQLARARGKSITAANNAAAQNNSTDLLKVLDKLINSPYSTDTKTAEKNADIALRSAQASSALRREQAWGGSAINQIDLEREEAAIRNTEAKISIYQKLNAEIEERRALETKVLDMQVEDGSLVKGSVLYNAELNKIKTKGAEAQKENNEKLAEALELYEQQIQKAKELADISFQGNFLMGLRSAWNQFSDIKKATQQFGADVTGTALEGTTEALANSFGTFINPDREKINDLKYSIAQLNREKSQLQTDIQTIEGNTTKTPEELSNLADKKSKLADINNQLAKQNEELQKNTNAWAAFAEGLKGVMDAILKELQRYIAKLIVVWIMEQAVNFAKAIGTGGTPIGSVGAGGTDLPGNMSPGATGNYQAAAGGMVPLNMGTPGVDSVHALLMPGEIVLSKSSVDYYGAGKLLDLNAKRIQKFAEGGLVGGPVGSSSEFSSKEKQEFSLTIVNVADPSSVPKMTGEEVINIVSFNAAQKGAVYKTIKGVVNG